MLVNNSRVHGSTGNRIGGRTPDACQEESLRSTGPRVHPTAESGLSYPNPVLKQYTGPLQLRLFRENTIKLMAVVLTHGRSH